jgi:hypothetical protein
MSSPWYVKGIHWITEVTKKAPDSGFDQGRLDHPVSPPIPAIAPPSSPCHPGSSILIDGRHEGSFTEEQARRGTGKELTKGDRCTCVFCTIPFCDVDWCDLAQMTIDALPDVALLTIFDFCMDRERIRGWEQPAWHRLVHVCRNWRNVIFGSPRRLELLLYCRAYTPVRQMLDIWPQLPIAIQASCYDGSPWNEDNIFAALKHNNRISEMHIFDTPDERETLLAALQQPFPALTTLVLEFYTNETLVVPASFLGGSAPDLRKLSLNLIPFPGLPNLLLTATHLVHLRLHNIPHSGYFSPEAMVTALAVLTSLKTLHIEFQFESPRSLPDRRLHPRTRVLLPALTELQLKGIREYPEGLVARIDARLLDRLIITFFHQLIFDSPQLIQFMSRTLKFKAHNEALVVFSSYNVSLTLPHTSDAMLEMRIPCNQSDRQLSSLARVCSSSIPRALMSTIERLRIENESIWQDDNENSQWLELFRSFTAVKYLSVSSNFMPHIAPALKELVGERVTEVLPALQTLDLYRPLAPGPVRETIEQFVAARQLAGHPIVVSHW